MGLLLVLALLTPAGAQDAGREGIGLPGDATALEGLPTVRVETTAQGVTRRQLDASEAAAHRLRIRIADGRFYWSSRDDRRLALTSSGGYTYLTSREPGRYVRIHRLNGTLSYVEHVETSTGIVTFWGELRVVIGR